VAPHAERGWWGGQDTTKKNLNMENGFLCILPLCVIFEIQHQNFYWHKKKLRGGAELNPFAGW